MSLYTVRNKAGLGTIMVLAVLLGVAWLVRARGSEWPLLHPDEYKISAWASWMEEHTRTSDPCYPGGYFHLVQPLLRLKNKVGDGLAHYDSFLGHGDRPGRSLEGVTFLLRKVNVGLGLATVLLLFAMARRMTGGVVGSLAVALFLALSPLHVEHCHYAETDIAMLFSLTLALYLWTRMLETRKVRWFLLACLVTGWAIGTKYINLVLLGCVPFGLVMCRGGFPAPIFSRRRALLLITGLALVAGGWVSVNRHVLDGAEFWSHLRGALASTYGERSGLLMQHAQDHWAAVRSNWNVFVRELGEWHPVWWIFTGLGALVVWRRVTRRYWGVAIVPLALYLLYFIRLAPWVRSQEFMVFLVLFGLLMAVGVEALWRSASQGRYVVGKRGVLLILIGWAALDNGVKACRMASLFGCPEPRIVAAKWLYSHAPLGDRVGIEDYTSPTCRIFQDTVGVYEVERTEPAALQALHTRYLLRNVSAQGRGTCDPFTGRLYPAFEANLASFENRAELLCDWDPGVDRFHFAGQHIQWWHTPAAKAAGRVMDYPVFRPVRIAETEVVCVEKDRGVIGSASGMWVDPVDRCFVLYGDGECGTVYVVLQTEERQATVEIDGMGFNDRVTVPAYSTRVVNVDRSRTWLRTTQYPVIHVRAVTAEHLREIPCYAEATTDPAEVVTILFQKGYRDRAIARLASIPPDSPRVQWLRFACAVEQGDWVQAERYRGAAERALADFEQFYTNATEECVLNGIHVPVYRDHARLRLPGLDTGSDGIAMQVQPVPVRLDRDDPQAAFTGCWRVPVRLGPGRYWLSGSVSTRVPDVVPDSWHVSMTDTLSGVQSDLVITEGRREHFERSYTVTREGSLQLTFFSSQAGGRLELSDLELRWDLDDLFWYPRREILRSLVLNALHRRDGSAANRLLERARVLVPHDGEWDRLAQDGELATHLRGEDVDRVFYPWLKLSGARMVDGQCLVDLVAMKGDIPPLTYELTRRQGRGFKALRQGAVPVSGLDPGQTATLTIPVEAGIALSNLNLQIRSDVKWLPSALRVRGTEDGRVALGP